MIKILKVIDQYGWAYDFVYKEQKKFSTYNIDAVKVEDLIKNVNIAKGYDIIYFHGPDLLYQPRIDDLIAAVRAVNRKVKVIGGYGGEIKVLYKDVDLVVAISYSFLPWLKQSYPGKPVIYLPEGIDSDYFKPYDRPVDRFNVGWAGRPRPIKRYDLLDSLKYPVVRKSDWGHEYFKKGRTLANMLEFYKGIDVLILLSESECMPRVVLEAMACGLLVVSTKVGSLSLVLESKCLVDNVGGWELVSLINEKLDYFRVCPASRAVVGKWNRDKIEKHFSWQIVAVVWDFMFKMLLDGEYTEIEGVSERYIKELKNE